VSSGAISRIQPDCGEGRIRYYLKV